MTATLHTDLAELVTCTGSGTAEDQLGVIQNAALVEESGTITWIGTADLAPECDVAVNHQGRVIIPAFVDSHTHLVFAGDRSAEFTARMSGARYDGGGIATTVGATRGASEEQLRRLLRRRVQESRAQGTGLLEIKTGYGLDVASETTAARLAAEVTADVTFLGAHVVPREYRHRRSDYVELVCGEMLQSVLPFVRWIDVFCEPHSEHSFTAEESREVLGAGQQAGLGLRLHGNQLGAGPGVQLAVELGAASVDHCTYLSDSDIDALASSETVATVLPGVEFSTRSPYPDARRLLDAGVRVGLATDCNPGTCYSSSIPFMIALAVREMGFRPAEALLAATVTSAQSLRRPKAGRIEVGGPADLTLVDAPSWQHLAYRPGVPLCQPLG